MIHDSPSLIITAIEINNMVGWGGRSRTNNPSCTQHQRLNTQTNIV